MKLGDSSSTNHDFDPSSDFADFNSRYRAAKSQQLKMGCSGYDLALLMSAQKPECVQIAIKNDCTHKKISIAGVNKEKMRTKASAKAIVRTTPSGRSVSCSMIPILGNPIRFIL